MLVDILPFFLIMIFAGGGLYLYWRLFMRPHWQQIQQEEGRSHVVVLQQETRPTTPYKEPVVRVVEADPPAPASKETMGEEDFFRHRYYLEHDVRKHYQIVVGQYIVMRQQASLINEGRISRDKMVGVGRILRSVEWDYLVGSADPTAKKGPGLLRRAGLITTTGSFLHTDILVAIQQLDAFLTEEAKQKNDGEDDYDGEDDEDNTYVYTENTTWPPMG